MVAKLSVKPSLDLIKADFKARKNKLSNLFPAHKKVSIFLDQWVQRNFQKEGSELGSDRWEPFDLGGRWSGLGKKRKFDALAKLLQDTGRLRFSFLPFATQRNAGVGSEIKYAKYHNEGEGVPKRRMLPKQSEVNKKIREILTNHGKKALKIA